MRTTPEIDAEIRDAEHRLSSIRQQMNDLTAKPDLTRGEEERFSNLERGASRAQEELADLRRERLSAGLNSGEYSTAPAVRPAEPDRDPMRDHRDLDRFRGTNPWEVCQRGTDPFTAFAAAAVTDVRARALSAIERMSGATDAARERAARIIEEFDDARGSLSQHVLLTSDPDYVAAFSRMLRGDTILTAEEARAWRRVSEYRSMTAGNLSGVMFPIQIDPTINLTNAGEDNPVRRLARQVVATGNVWKPVTSAGVTASYDTEGSEVSDDTPTLSQGSISVHTARTFVPFSIEAGMDTPNLTAELARVSADAMNVLESAAFVTGTGTNEPRGIVTALDANTNVEVQTTTSNVFGVVDVYKLYEELPARFEGNSTAWTAHKKILSDVQQFGTSEAHTQTIDLTGTTRTILGRPAHLSSAMDSTITAGSQENIMVYGAWDRYVIAQRLGFTGEIVPHLFGTTNNRPTGERGFFGFARHGGDSVVDNAFRMLVARTNT